MLFNAYLGKYEDSWLEQYMPLFTKKNAYMADNNQTTSQELIGVFKKLEPRLNKVYVGATLKNAITMQNNRYIRLL
ncbi:MAG: hypothetical protein AAF632_29815 [Bacteroidota bacterium]